MYICRALRDLVPFAQFEKREKHPKRSVNFSKVALLLGYFSNGTESRNAPHISYYQFDKINTLLSIKK